MHIYSYYKGKTSYQEVLWPLSLNMISIFPRNHNEMTVHTIMPLKNGMSGTCLPYRLLYTNTVNHMFWKKPINLINLLQEAWKVKVNSNCILVTNYGSPAKYYFNWLIYRDSDQWL